MSIAVDPATSEWGVRRQWPGRRATFAHLPIGAVGAFTPVGIVASNERDAWVGGTLVTSPYSDDFPGCPSIVNADADAVYLAHFDGARWTRVAFPGDGPLSSIELAPDGMLLVVAGWPRGMVPFRAVKWAAPQEWIRSVRGEWTKTTDFRTAHAMRAGYRVVDGRAERLDAFGQWTEIILPRADQERESVRFWPVAIRTNGDDDREVWIDAEQVTDEDGEVRALGMRTWLRTR